MSSFVTVTSDYPVFSRSQMMRINDALIRYRKCYPMLMDDVELLVTLVTQHVDIYTSTDGIKDTESPL